MKPTTYHNEADPQPSGTGTLLTDAALSNPPPSDPPPSILRDWTGEGGALKPEFLETIGKIHPELAPTFGKYKTESDLFKGIANLASLAGKKAEGIRVPGADAKPEEIAEFRKALGVPETVDGYEITAPENLPEGVQWNPEVVKQFAEVLHKHHVPPVVAKELVALDIARREQEAAIFAKEEEAHMQAQRDALRQEYGADVPQKLELAKKAANLIGLPLDHYALADAAVVKALVKLSGLVSEDKFTGQGAVVQTADLEAQLAQVQSSEEYKRGDASARAKVHEIALKLAQARGFSD